LRLKRALRPRNRSELRGSRLWNLLLRVDSQLNRLSRNVKSAWNALARARLRRRLRVRQTARVTTVERTNKFANRMRRNLVKRREIRDKNRAVDRTTRVRARTRVASQAIGELAVLARTMDRTALAVR
jgi:hypothetical protein